MLIGDRYRLHGELGSGGFGRVWHARDETLGVDVAIKELTLPAEAARAAREARNAARLRDHPNIVTVHDVVVENDVPWIVMQLVEGRSLERHLKEHGPLPVADVARIAAALLDALEAADRAGLVHRDVKPGNVLLTASGEVLLTDFGIAVHQADTALTASGMFIGSMEYTAPERSRGEEATVAADLFSLGVTLYQAVEGISPFRRDTPAATLGAVLMEPPPPPTRAGHLTPLITRLLEKDPAARPAIAEARTMTGPPPAGGTRVLTDPAPAKPARAPRVPWQKWGLWLILAFLLVAGVAGAFHADDLRDTWEPTIYHLTGPDTGSVMSVVSGILDALTAAGMLVTGVLFALSVPEALPATAGLTVGVLARAAALLVGVGACFFAVHTCASVLTAAGLSPGKALAASVLGIAVLLAVAVGWYAETRPRKAT